LFSREKAASTIREAVDHAGTLVVATLAIASCALVIALAALFVAMKMRTA
jgi:hypothetical protein